MENQMSRIVVAGAGYAGMLATVRTAGKLKSEIQNGQVAITLVNPVDVFVERLRLHQFATNQTVAHRPIAELLRGTGVSFLRGTVTRIDPAGRTIEVRTGTDVQEIAYDYLLYALGSTINRDSVPGVRENAYVLTPGGDHSAAALREVLPELGASPRGARVLVCGAGPTGIETAAEFASSFPNLKVQLVTRGEFGRFTNKPIADYMRRSLERLGVSIQDHTAIAEVRADKAVTASGAEIPFDLCLWAGGFSAHRLAGESGLAVNVRGQILVDPFLRSISYPSIYAAGDAGTPADSREFPVRMAAITAAFMGAHAADNLTAAIRGKRSKPFGFAYLGQGIALGKNNAIGFNNYPDDLPKAPYFTGRLGYEGREFFVRVLADLPKLERRWPGITFWLGKGRHAKAKQQGRDSSLHTRPSISSSLRRGL